MSTILPEDMFGGRRMDGNSICRTIKGQPEAPQCKGRVVSSTTNSLMPYQSLILGQEYCNARINFANRERDQHAGVSGWVVDGRIEICLAKLVAKLSGSSTFFGKAVNNPLASVSRLSSIHTYIMEEACNASHYTYKCLLAFKTL
jgi:hypothetical protein